MRFFIYLFYKLIIIQMIATSGTESCVATCGSSSLMNPNCECLNLFFFSKLRSCTILLILLVYLFVCTVQPRAGARPHPLFLVHGRRLPLGCDEHGVGSQRPGCPPHVPPLHLLPLRPQKGHSAAAGRHSAGATMLC